MELLDFLYSDVGAKKWANSLYRCAKGKKSQRVKQVPEFEGGDIAIVVDKTYLQTRQQVWEKIAYSEMNLQKPARSKLARQVSSPVSVGSPIPVIGPSVPMPVSSQAMTLLPPGHMLTHAPAQSVSPNINVTEDPLAAFEAAMMNIDAKKAQQQNNRYDDGYTRGQDYSSQSLSARRKVRSRSPSPGKGDNKRRRLDTEQRRRDRKMSKRDLRHKLRTGTWRHQGN